jgi:hypothetical protein
MNVLIKNWNKDSINLSLFTGRASFTNLQIKEQVIQEFISFPYIQVKSCILNKLSFQLPSLTRLENDPIIGK